MTSESIDLNCVAAPDLGRVVAVVLAALANLIFRSFSRDPKRLAVQVALCNYLNRTAARFDRLLARLAAGKLTPPRPARPRPARPDAEPKSRPPRVRFPRRRAWIVEDLKHHGAVRAFQIEFLLNRPEHAARLADCPQAHRLLRPLCHMLGIAPACIPPLPRRPRKPRPKPGPKPRRLSYKEREALLWYPNIEGRPMKLLPPRAVLAREPPAYLPVPKKAV
jgi:hypothetical protein